MSDLADPLRDRNQVEVNLIAKAWQDQSFRQELLKDPNAAIEREVGHKIPQGCQFETIEESPNCFYVVLPRKPHLVEVSEELSDAALQNVAGGAMLVMGGETWNFLSAGVDGKDGNKYTAYFLFTGW